MKKEIILTKTEKKLELFLNFFCLLSLIVIGFGMYFQNNNIDKDYLLVPILFAIYIVSLGMYAYNGLTDANLIKKWTPTFYLLILWIVKKINTNEQKAEKSAIMIISLISILFCLILIVFEIKLQYDNQLLLSSIDRLK
jgi:hypothetical protein